MQLFPEELALANLKGEIQEGERGFSNRETALEFLKELSGEDFGMDVELWELWVKALGYPSKTANPVRKQKW